jgi:hypothetical protein
VDGRPDDSAGLHETSVVFESGSVASCAALGMLSPIPALHKKVVLPTLALEVRPSPRPQQILYPKSNLLFRGYGKLPVIGIEVVHTWPGN